MLGLLIWKIFLILHKFFNAIFHDKNGRVGFLTPSIHHNRQPTFYSMTRCWSELCVWLGPLHAQTKEVTWGEGNDTSLIDYSRLLRPGNSTIIYTLFVDLYRRCINYVRLCLQRSTTQGPLKKNRPKTEWSKEEGAVFLNKVLA